MAERTWRRRLPCTVRTPAARTLRMSRARPGPSGTRGVVVTTAPSITAPPLEQPIARYRTALATTSSELDAAQRLRHQVFGLECGARLHPAGAATGRDVDEGDEHCDPLVVREEVSDRVVGTYRLLRPERAAALGRSYGDGEFDLSRHAALRPGLVEAGRSCVHPDHRTGAVISQLWAGVARYVLD